MDNNILFVFEGEKTEKLVSKSIKRIYFDDRTIITCAYCNNLYNLHREISADEDLDTFSLLKSMGINRDILAPYDRTDFAEIFLFFDYDGHDTVADDDKVLAMLNFFNEETEQGKLYISYPMVEALKHFTGNESFRDLKVKCKENINYKKLVSDEAHKEFLQLNNYEREIWNTLIICHLSKMNHIVEDVYKFPIRLMFQDEIFEHQLTKYISVDQTTAVLSAFPLFLHDYFGNKSLIEKIKK